MSNAQIQKSAMETEEKGLPISKVFKAFKLCRIVGVK
jgi:hypothetical protein